MEEEKIMELAKRGGKLEDAMAELLESEIKTVAKSSTKIAEDLVLFGMMWHGERLKEQAMAALDKLKKKAENGN